MGELLGFEVNHHSLHLYANPVLIDDNRCKNCNIEINLKDE
jgi:hypothetical protein